MSTVLFASLGRGSEGLNTQQILVRVDFVPVMAMSLTRSQWWCCFFYG